MKQFTYGILIMIALAMTTKSQDDQDNTRTVVSFHGTRLRGFPEGRVDLTSNDDAWEKWTWNYIGDDKYTLRSAHGTYLRANPDGTVDLAPEAREWETWTEGVVNGRNTWKSFHGTYLRANPDGRVDLAPEAREWETWEA